MSSPARENRIVRRMMEWDSGRRSMTRRFNKAIDRHDKRLKSMSNAIVFVDGIGWMDAGGRGLIHNGRKP